MRNRWKVLGYSDGVRFRVTRNIRVRVKIKIWFAAWGRSSVVQPALRLALGLRSAFALWLALALRIALGLQSVLGSGLGVRTRVRVKDEAGQGSMALPPIQVPTPSPQLTLTLALTLTPDSGPRSRPCPSAALLIGWPNILELKVCFRHPCPYPCF